MAASVTSLESGGLGDVNKDDEKQTEKTGGIAHIAATSSKETNLSSGEGDRQNTEIIHRHKEVDYSSSVDYPQQATSSAKESQITEPKVLIEKSSTNDSSLASNLSSGKGDKQHAETAHRQKEADQSSSVDYPRVTSSATELQITGIKILIVESSAKELDLASGEGDGKNVEAVRRHKELDQSSSVDYPQATSSAEESQFKGSEILKTSSTTDSDLGSGEDEEQNSGTVDKLREPGRSSSVDYPEATSSAEESQIKGSEVLIEKSSPKEPDVASETSPVIEPTVEQTGTDQQTVSTLTTPPEEVNAENIVLTSSQDVSVPESKFAAEDLQQKSDCSENKSPAKPTLKSEVSEEDNVFDDGTKTQAPEVTSNSDEPGILKSASSEPTSNAQHEKLETEVYEERPIREMLVRRSRTESTDSITDRPHVEPLTFSVAKHIETINDEETKVNDMCECLLCDRSYPASSKEDVLAHMVLMHKFVIADVNFIGIFPEYMRYWKKRFEDKPYSEFCSKIVTNAGVKDDASKEEFFLLCDALPEDKALREDLQRKKLESVLAQQQKEREETKFCRQCLFCNQTFCGNRAVLLDHLVRDHSFHVGQPDNLVFTDELFDLIQSKLDSLLCLFCEKAFKDKPSLREHMRKKQHRKINPKHKEYDRFYIVNYMEMGKNWQSLQSEDSRLDKTNEKNINEEDEWSGWNEDSASKFVCLFCDVTCDAVTDLLEHMKDTHSFDLHELSTRLQLNFYQKVKIVNFIRKQVYLNTCYGCQQTFQAIDELLAHLNEFPTHSQSLPDAEEWDQEIYFAPTYEDDRLLCCLEDGNDDGDDNDDDSGDGASGDTLVAAVIQEDIPIPDTILLRDKKLCQDLLKT